MGVLFSIHFTGLRIWFVIPWFQRNTNSGNGRNDVPSVPTRYLILSYHHVRGVFHVSVQ